MEIKRRVNYCILMVAIILPLLLYAILAERASWLPKMRKVYKSELVGLNFSNDGKLLISQGYEDGTVLFQLHDPYTLQTVRSLIAPTACEGMTLAPNLVTAACSESYSHYYPEVQESHDAYRIALYDVVHNQRLYAGLDTTDFNAIGFSAQGDLLACGASSTGPGPAGHDSGQWMLWRVQGHKLQGPLVWNGDQVYCIAFAANGKRVVTGLVGGALKIWSTESYKLLRTLTAHVGKEDINDAVTVAISADGKLIASAHADGTVWLWNALTGKSMHIFSTQSQVGPMLSFAPDGTMLATGGASGVIKLWDVQTGQELRALRTVHGNVGSIVFAPDGSTLASGYKDGTVALWRIK